MQRMIFTFDGCPKWVGYQTEQHTALFDLNTTKEIVAYQNHQHKKFPDGNWDYFSWDNGRLTWYSYDGDENGVAQYTTIEVFPVTIDNGIYYPLGEGSWVWNTEDITFSDDTVLQVARTFSFLLLYQIGHENMQKAIETNNTALKNSIGCASHNYCDANMVMYDASKAVTGREPEINDDLDLALWNNAWLIAKANDFYYDFLKQK